MSGPSNEQIVAAVSGFTRRDLSVMYGRMKVQRDEVLAKAKDKKLPFRVRRTAAAEARVRSDQLDLYREIAEQMVDEDALTIGDLGDLAVARMCGYGAESEAERD